MRRKSQKNPKPEQPTHYAICLKGELPTVWAEWFDGMSLTRTAEGETLLTGPVADQAALFGLLKKVRDLGIPLVSVDPVPVERKKGVGKHGK